MQRGTGMFIAGLGRARSPPRVGTRTARTNRHDTHKRWVGVSTPTHQTNDEEYTMTTHIAATPSVSHLDPWRDVTVQVTFKTVDPITMTEIVVDPDPSSDGCLLQLIDAAITRLRAYREAFTRAEKDDAGSRPPTALPVPWYAWGR